MRARGGAVAGALAAAVVAATACGGGPSQPTEEVRLRVANGSHADERLVTPAFERAIRSVNGEIRLPTQLEVRMVGEEEAGRRGISAPTYEPRDRAVYFPWSFVEDARRQLPRDPQRRDAMVFALYHELTHGLIDVLDVPVVGGEERAADSLAAVLALRSPGDGAAVPLGMARLLEARSRDRRRPPGPADYADDHELDAERAVDALCLVFGSDPSRYAGLVGDGLPKSRADGCAFEYREELRSWRRLLARWLTESGGLRPESESAGRN